MVISQRVMVSCLFVRHDSLTVAAPPPHHQQFVVNCLREKPDKMLQREHPEGISKLYTLVISFCKTNITSHTSFKNFVFLSCQLKPYVSYKAPKTSIPEPTPEGLLASIKEKIHLLKYRETP